MQRYIEEGLRMDHHAGIESRPGPAGCRPALAGGPDVWEVVRVVRNAEAPGDGAFAEAAVWLGPSGARVRIALGYFADYPAEIDSWLARIDVQAAEAEELSRRQTPGNLFPGFTPKPFPTVDGQGYQSQRRARRVRCTALLGAPDAGKLRYQALIPCPVKELRDRVSA
jgi:hypothetical protein